jgi:hypothetical protein
MELFAGNSQDIVVHFCSFQLIVLGGVVICKFGVSPAAGKVSRGLRREATRGK